MQKFSLIFSLTGKVFPYFFPYAVDIKLYEKNIKNPETLAVQALDDTRMTLQCNIEANSSPASRTKKTSGICLDIAGFSMYLCAFLIRKVISIESRFFVFPYFFPYQIATDFINRSIRSALDCFICSVTWPYMSSVNAAVACPRFSCTVFISSPDRIDATA